MLLFRTKKNCQICSGKQVPKKTCSGSTCSDKFGLGRVRPIGFQLKRLLGYREGLTRNESASVRLPPIPSPNFFGTGFDLGFGFFSGEKSLISQTNTRRFFKREKIFDRNFRFRQKLFSPDFSENLKQLSKFHKLCQIAATISFY